MAIGEKPYAGAEPKARFALLGSGAHFSHWLCLL